jgi:hypothetical protein
MELLLLLYTLNFVKVPETKYQQAIETSRNAVLIQSGAQHEFDKIKHNAGRFAKEQGLAQPLAVVGWGYKGIKEHEWQLKTRYGTVKANTGSVVYMLEISF